MNIRGTPLFWQDNKVLFYGGGGGFRRRRYYKRSSSAKFDKAYEMRNNPTRAEARLWDLLHGQVYQNFPNNIFYRQSVQYGYILDFYCPTLRLGIEVDGCVHDNQKEYDDYRDLQLAGHGIQVERFTNDEVLFNSEETTARIFQEITEKSEYLKSLPVKRAGCFIATAAYGTPMAQEINALRRFRDLKMEPNLIGRQLITLYYNVSLPFANVISRSNNMKAFVRLNLKPIIQILESSRNP